MKPELFSRYTFRRALRRPLVVKGHESQVREGFWLEFKGSKGELVRSECAPLPGWHEESLVEVEKVLLNIAPIFCEAISRPKIWSWGEAYFGQWQPEIEIPVSLKTSLEVLILQIYQSQLSDLSFPNPKYQLPMQQAALLQLRSDQTTAQRWCEIQAMWDQGFRTFKVKLWSQDLAEEFSLLLKMKAHFGQQLRLRLDFNQGSGMDLNQVREWSKNLPIEYWEEPAQSLWAELRSLDMPLACDEGLRGVDPDRDTWPDTEVLVLKPSQLGLQRTLRWLDLGAKRGCLLVMSNCYEAEATLQLYAWLYRASVRQPLALGFGTLGLFSQPWQDNELVVWQPQSPWPVSAFPQFLAPSFWGERRELWRL